jgi:hypothetical protein
VSGGSCDIVAIVRHVHRSAAPSGRQLAGTLAVVLIAVASGRATNAAAAPRPDLSVSSLRATVLPATTACPRTTCVPLRIGIHLRNRGAARAIATRTSLLFSRDRRRDLGDRPLLDLRAAPLRARSTAPLRTLTRRLGGAALSRLRAAGTSWFLLACADGGRRVAERRESDNCRAVHVILPARPPTTSAGPGSPVGPVPGAGPVIVIQPPGTSPPATGCEAVDWHADLCRVLRDRLAAHAFADTADALAFALLFQEQQTGQPVPASIAAAAMGAVRREADVVSGAGAGVPDARVRGYLDFWHAAPRPSGDRDAGYAAYLTKQDAAAHGPANADTAAMLASDAGWQDGIQRWSAEDQAALGAAAYAGAIALAQRTAEDVDTALRP